MAFLIKNRKENNGMNIIEVKQAIKQAIDVKIAEYTKDLKSPLGWGYEDNIRGIIAGLREAKKIISKVK